VPGKSPRSAVATIAWGFSPETDIRKGDRLKQETS
jgi:hypothetical protein